MKTHLNTLFVTTDGAYLAKDGQAVAVRVEKKTVLRIPFHNLEGIVCFGRIGCSPALMGACAELNITISFMSEYGKFRAAVVGFSPGNVLLRRQQYRVADDLERSVECSRNSIAAKIANCKSVLLRAARDSKDDNRISHLEKTARKMNNSLDAARNATKLDQLRGIEGDAASTYFGSFNLLISDQSKEFEFTVRSKRPPLDPINSLLSFLYALLTHDARSACEATGLDSAVGFLHRDRSGRPGMALDLMEEFRPFLVDRLVLSLINRRQVSITDFQKEETGAVYINDDARKKIMVAYQKRKQDTITHPFLNEKMSIGLLIHIQARLMARWLRNNLDTYPAFIWK